MKKETLFAIVVMSIFMLVVSVIVFIPAILLEILNFITNDNYDYTPMVAFVFWLLYAISFVIVKKVYKYKGEN